LWNVETVLSVATAATVDAGFLDGSAVVFGRPFWTRTMRIGEIYIYIYNIKGVNKHEQGWQWWCLTCSGSVSTTFRPASAAYIRVHIMYIYIIILLCIIWSLGPSIVFSDVPPRIIHTVSAAVTTAAPIHVIYSFIKQQTEGCRAKFHPKDEAIEFPRLCFYNNNAIIILYYINLTSFSC